MFKPMTTLNKQKQLTIIWNILTTIGLIGCILFFIYGIKSELFYSKEALEDFLGQFGIWAPVLFVALQAVQVIIPILPGGISLLGGVLIFGPVMGIIYNYIGICLGSVAVFLIANKYGDTVIHFLFNPKLRKKYHGWVNHRRFGLFFTFMIFSPVAPDDFLCYLAGTTKMSLRKYTTIILIGKPLPIVLYSFGLEWIFRHVVSIFS
ncbi:TVP38/TMEM64 family protein [Aquibacillus rhizosphaerae]|uniref:TVP38/TMEM64 family membrane protein n=1 Tax=Aquibacillus rhizosphaerae TaxID=3051431 RepID=A0ABT7LDB4_9BACI|nr:TVP38/TMEM64 family protein [Aquibacillus sp. LR5S19]MDL4842590.1 TVP38/TMEM64 family protein [Aquibacillus sp. LR5S19]